MLADKSKIILLVVATSLVVTGAVVYNRLNANDTAPGSETSQESDSSSQVDTTNSENQEISEGEEKKLATIEDSTTNTPPATEPSITSANVQITQLQQESNNVVVQTKLTGSGGWSKCTLKLTHGDNTFEKNADAIFQPEFSTCAGFSIPVNEFAESGEWVVVLTASMVDGTTISSAKDTYKISVIK